MTNERSPVEMDHSSVNILPGKIHPDVEFIFINGIFNTKEDALQSGRFIQESLNGYQVNVMHNASHGALDLFDFAIEKVGISTSVCIQLYHLMKSGIDSGKTVILQAHSEGGTITKRALGMLTDEEKASVRFIGYGTGSIISDHLLISNETNISMGDLVALGANFCKTLVFPERYSGQINYLEPKQGGIDHGILGPTYRDKIKKVGEDLKTEYDLNRRGL